MGAIKGDLTVMPLTDILQWVEMGRKTGTILLHSGDTEKKFYVEDGRIIFISSNKQGERLGEYLHKGSFIDANKIRSALLQSQTMKIHFTQRLIDLNYFSAETLKEIIINHAKEILMDAMSWPDGSFEFNQDVLPAYVVRGTISLNASEFMHEVLRQAETDAPGSSGT
jgi:hypothetical protein